MGEFWAVVYTDQESYFVLLLIFFLLIFYKAISMSKAIILHIYFDIMPVYPYNHFKMPFELKVSG